MLEVSLASGPEEVMTSHKSTFDQAVLEARPLARARKSGVLIICLLVVASGHWRLKEGDWRWLMTRAGDARDARHRPRLQGDEVDERLVIVPSLSTV